MQEDQLHLILYIKRWKNLVQSFNYYKLKRISWSLSLYHQFKTEIDYKLYSINIPFTSTSSAWVIARIILYLEEEPISDASR